MGGQTSIEKINEANTFLDDVEIYTSKVLRDVEEAVKYKKKSILEEASKELKYKVKRISRVKRNDQLGLTIRRRCEKLLCDVSILLEKIGDIKKVLVDSTTQNSSKEVSSSDEDAEIIYTNVDITTKISKKPDINKTLRIRSHPMSFPKSEQENLVREMPRHYRRLNEILKKSVTDHDDILEAYSKRDKCKAVRDIFNERIEQVFMRYMNK